MGGDQERLLLLDHYVFIAENRNSRTWIKYVGLVDCLFFLSQVQAPDGGKDTWSLLYDLVCQELCQPDDPPIIVQEQKTVLASILSVLSAMFASQTEQEYTRIRKSKLYSFLFFFCLFFQKLIFRVGFMWVWKGVQFSDIAYSKTLPCLLKITASPKFSYWVGCKF